MAAPPLPRSISFMKCWAGLALFGAGVFGNSRLSETARPLRTSEAARTRFSAVIRLTAPTWSSAPPAAPVAPVAQVGLDFSFGRDGTLEHGAPPEERVPSSEF